MKSAYELAMERLQKASPSVPLTDSQKQEIAEIDNLYKSKMAEKEVFLQDQIRKAESSGNFEEIEALRTQLSRELRRLQEEAEEKKEKVRNTK